MAPDKFEKYIKEKVRQREILPSDDAWERIAEQLPVEAKKDKKPIVWYSIAASFIGILIATLYFTQTTKTEVNSPTPVVISEENQRADNLKHVKPEVDPSETKAEEALASQPAIEPNGRQIPLVQEVETANAAENADFETAVATKTDVKEGRVPEIVQQREELFIEAKVDEVVAQVRLLEQNDEALTEAEVDSLLRKAQNELLNDRLFKADNTVDALALLNEVEAELDQSFRDQIFESLKTGFMKVRTALADRNN